MAEHLPISHPGAAAWFERVLSAGGAHTTAPAARQAGYAVIFLTRRGTIQPFTEGLPSGELLECLVHAPAPDCEQVTPCPAP